MVIPASGEIPRISAGNGTADLNGDVQPAQVIEKRAIRCCGENCRFRFPIFGMDVSYLARNR